MTTTKEIYSDLVERETISLDLCTHCNRNDPKMKEWMEGMLKEMEETQNITADYYKSAKEFVKQGEKLTRESWLNVLFCSAIGSIVLFIWIINH